MSLSKPCMLVAILMAPWGLGDLCSQWWHICPIWVVVPWQLGILWGRFNAIGCKILPHIRTWIVVLVLGVMKSLRSLTKASNSLPNSLPTWTSIEVFLPRCHKCHKRKKNAPKDCLHGPQSWYGLSHYHTCQQSLQMCSKMPPHGTSIDVWGSMSSYVPIKPQIRVQ